MHLVLDIGNSRVKAGLFSGKDLIQQTAWANWHPEALRAFTEISPVTAVLVSSVAAPDVFSIDLLEKYFPHVTELTHSSPLPFSNTYTTPETLGKDRLAAVAGAQALFPTTSTLVIDCGTCIKYDLLENGVVYRGGNIAPGAKMRLHAMHVFTARLPEPPFVIPDVPIGHNTETALQNGGLLGAVLEMQGFARLLFQHVSFSHIVISGGDAAFFAPYLAATLPGCSVLTEPNLNLYGLNHILSHHLNLQSQA